VLQNFILISPYIVIDFFLNNQPDALIIQIHSFIKVYMFRHLLCPSSGVFHCTFGTCKFDAGFDDRIQTESGCSILTRFGYGHQNLHETHQCRMYSEKILMMGKEEARNM
jgi:hypothetical protein